VHDLGAVDRWYDIPRDANGLIEDGLVALIQLAYGLTRETPKKVIVIQREDISDLQVVTARNLLETNSREENEKLDKDCFIMPLMTGFSHRDMTEMIGTIIKSHKPDYILVHPVWGFCLLAENEYTAKNRLNRYWGGKLSKVTFLEGIQGVGILEINNKFEEELEFNDMFEVESQ